MCGFAGLTWWEGNGPPNVKDLIARMTQAIDYRGPDSYGSISCSFAEVGFKRLSIIDLDTGDQPVSNQDGSIQAFLNGEIYNYQSLRKQLIEDGYSLRSESDSEIIPYLYEIYGTEFVDYLNGMFAICIVDRKHEVTTLYRDRLGIKPLYYACKDGNLIFGSELKSVIASGMIEPELDASQIAVFLANFYCPGTNTMVRGINKLLPGESITVARSAPPSLNRYFEIPNRNDAAVRPLDIDELDRLLAESVKLQLVADVPVGISLSGGLDSSLITMYAARANRSDLKLFTVNFENTPQEELDCARDVAAEFGIDHEILSATTNQLVNEAPAIFWINDEPVADPAFYPACKVSAAAANYVKVLLTGTGADELFAGYGHYSLSSKKQALAHYLPGFLSRSKIFRKLMAGSLNYGEFEALIQYKRDRFPWHVLQLSSFDYESCQALNAHVPDGSSPEEPIRAAFAKCSGLDPLNQQLYTDLTTYLPDMLLPVLDRSTMGASIEGRVPFLDHRIVETVMQIPGPAKMASNKQKYLLRKLARGRLPDSVLDRRKLGFPNAVTVWLAGELGDMLPQIFEAPDSLAQRYLPADWVRSLYASKQATLNNWRLIYGIFVLQVWYEVMIKNPRQSPPTESLADLFQIPG